MSQKTKLTIFLSLILSVFPPANSIALETPKPNALCVNEGFFGIAEGKMMTCTSDGTNLIWKLNPNVIAGGLCSAWLPGDTATWAELQLFENGKWVTQKLPIAFTPGPNCDKSKVNSSIPWIALPNKVANGTKFRWVHGNSGKDGHGGREFGKGYPDPAFVYTSATMRAPYLKKYTAIVAPVIGPSVYAANKALTESASPAAQ